MIDERYSRQARFEPIGAEGQRKIGIARVGVAGLGALGTGVAEQLARAGVGALRIIDRDVVELSNLQRQSLYDEADARHGWPKAVAAERRLKQINSSVSIEAVVGDLNSQNVEEWIGGLDLVVDGLDNFETRFVLNDACRKQKAPWIYGAAVGSYGVVMPIVPAGPCLRCGVGDLPPPGSSPTCETSGVIAPVTGAVASLEVALALRVLVGKLGPGDVGLFSVDVWTGAFRRIAMPVSLAEDCPLCSQGRYDYLGSGPVRTVTLCGRNAVQIIPGSRTPIDLDGLGRTLASVGAVDVNEFLLRCASPPYELTLFSDGRAIVRGTEEPAVAKSVYARLVGM
jgi:adenylyltransferase/sulfurtransferase